MPHQKTNASTEFTNQNNLGQKGTIYNLNLDYTSTKRSSYNKRNFTVHSWFGNRKSRKIGDKYL